MNENHMPHPGDTPEVNVFSGDLSIRDALHQLRLRLLDLTGRNRLLNFKTGNAKSLQFASSSPEAVFSRLLGANPRVTIQPVPEPPASAWVQKNGRSVRPDAREYAAENGISTSFDLSRTNMRAPAAASSGAQLRTLFYADELAVRCRKLEREARLAIEETGANMLYLVLGFLEFPEKDESDKQFLAPLACVPVRLEKTTGERYDIYNLVFTGEELEDNASLREKVKRDFSLTLPEFGDETDSLSDYLEAVEEAVANRPRWKVRRFATLTLLSFANAMLVRELEPENWPLVSGESSLLRHPIVRQVFEGGATREADGSSIYASEHAVDEHRFADLPFIYDADSSQHSALIDAFEGKNLVIEGPPGTGKSQTITNLIAASLNAGKKVLFVSEKLAALQVVKSRLEQAGLQDFVLELHSNKTSKKQVLEEIERRLSYQKRAPAGLEERLTTLQQKRNELKAYADLLNTVVENAQDLTVHQVLWRAEHFRRKCSIVTHATGELYFDGAQHSTISRFQSLIDLLKYLSRQHAAIGGLNSDKPFAGFYPEALGPGDESHIRSTLERFVLYFDEFAGAIEHAVRLVGDGATRLSPNELSKLLSVLVDLTPSNPDEIALHALPRLFTKDDPQAHAAEKTLDDAAHDINEILNLTRAGQFWGSSAAPSEELITNLEAQQSALSVLGLDDCSPLKLADMVHRLGSLVSQTEVILQSLRTVSESAGIPFADTIQHCKALNALSMVASTAPLEWLRLRHAGLASDLE